MLYFAAILLYFFFHEIFHYRHFTHAYFPMPSEPDCCCCRHSAALISPLIRCRCFAIYYVAAADDFSLISFFCYAFAYASPLIIFVYGCRQRRVTLLPLSMPHFAIRH